MRWLKRLVVVTAISPVRRILAVVIAGLTSAGLGYLATHGVPAIGPGWFTHARGFAEQSYNCFGRGCEPPSETGQTFLASLLLGLVGFGSAGIIAGLRRPLRRVSPQKLPQGWR